MELKWLTRLAHRRWYAIGAHCQHDNRENWEACAFWFIEEGRNECYRCRNVSKCVCVFFFWESSRRLRNLLCGVKYRIQQYFSISATLYILRSRAFTYMACKRRNFYDSYLWAINFFWKWRVWINCTFFSTINVKFDETYKQIIIVSQCK